MASIIPVDFIFSNRGKHTIDKNERPDGISAMHAFLNLFKAMVGAGVLSLPLAFKQSGLWCGAILMVLMGVITYYSYKKLVECAQHLAKKHNFHSLDYGAMAESAFKHSFRPIRKFASAARCLVNSSIFAFQIGSCSVYFDFVKEHVYEALLHVYPDWPLSKFTVSLFVFAGLVLLCQIRHLRSISYVSLLGNVVMIAALAIIFPQLIGGDRVKQELPKIQDISGIVMAAGSILYAFEGQTMILPLENKMKHPRKMMGLTGVLTMGCFMVTILYVACGYFGYVTYGSEVRGSIALNLPNTPLFFYLKVMLAVVVFLTYLVQMYVVVDMLWPRVEKAVGNGFLGQQIILVESMFRTLLVLLTFAIATCIPDLDNIIPLVGITAGMLLALIIPPLVDTTTFLPEMIEQKEYGRIAVNMTLNIVVFILGVFFLITGVATNFHKLMQAHS